MLYACCLTLKSQLRYGTIPIISPLFSLKKFPLPPFFAISSFSTLPVSIFIPPQEVASPCPSSLLLLPFFLFHIWPGSCGWPGFSGVGRCGGEEEEEEERGGGVVEF